MNSEGELISLIQERVMYKNRKRVRGNVLAVALGSLMLGYCLSYFSSVPILHLMGTYNFRFTCMGNAVAFLAGTTPIGAAIGAFFSSILNKFLSRRKSLIATAIFMTLGTGFTLIETFPTLIVGRFIQGVAIGFYSVLVPVYINQICPIQLSGKYGAFNQMLIVLGVLLSNLLGLMITRKSSQNCVENRIITIDQQITPRVRIIFALPIIFAALQIILLTFIYSNQTPSYLYSVGRDEEALQLIQQIYLDQFVEQVVVEKKDQRSDSNLIESGALTQTISLRARKLTSFIAYEIAFLQQMCGIMVVVLYGRELLFQALGNINVARIMQPTIILTQLVGCFLSFTIIKKIGRKPLIQFGTAATIILSALTGLSYCFEFAKKQIVTGSLYLFMISYGVTLGPTAWIYIPQIAPGNIVPRAIAVGWLAASTFQSTSDFLNYIVFFISSFLCSICFIINNKFLVQTKNQTKKEIKRSFQVIIHKQSNS